MNRQQSKDLITESINKGADKDFLKIYSASNSNHQNFEPKGEDGSD